MSCREWVVRKKNTPQLTRLDRTLSHRCKGWPIPSEVHCCMTRVWNKCLWLKTIEIPLKRFLKCSRNKIFFMLTCTVLWRLIHRNMRVFERIKHRIWLNVNNFSFFILKIRNIDMYQCFSFSFPFQITKDHYSQFENEL